MVTIAVYMNLSEKDLQWSLTPDHSRKIVKLALFIDDCTETFIQPGGLFEPS